MIRYDVCNGDADGLCATLQWRLFEPADTTLVTGLKREIELLQRVPLPADEIAVFDIAIARNRAALLRLLEGGARVRYFDHHAVGEGIAHPGLTLHVDLSPDVCSSLLVARATDEMFGLWAVVGAFGDNLGGQARALGERLGLEPAQIDTLRRLGELINYNAYGETRADVLLPPERMFGRMLDWVDPLLMGGGDPLIDQLEAQRREDLHAAHGAVRWSAPGAAVYELPDLPASRRVAGTLANTLARQDPQRAIAVLLPMTRASADDPAADTANAGGVAQRFWRVSVRAPLVAPGGAAELCASFGGSGRAGAGGIDALPDALVDAFVAAFAAATWGKAATPSA